MESIQTMIEMTYFKKFRILHLFFVEQKSVTEQAQWEVEKDGIDIDH